MMQSFHCCFHRVGTAAICFVNGAVQCTHCCSSFETRQYHNLEPGCCTQLHTHTHTHTRKDAQVRITETKQCNYSDLFDLHSRYMRSQYYQSEMDSPEAACPVHGPASVTDFRKSHIRM